MRVGLVADTHELRDPLPLLRQLAQSECARNVHLGDIAGSWAVTELARRFKRDDGPGALSEPQRVLYERSRAAGLTPVAAYVEASLGEDAECRKRRREEIERNYSRVVEAMSRLPRPFFLAGNVDNVLVRVGNNAATFDRCGTQLVTSPATWEEGGAAFLAWPSLKKSPDQLWTALGEVGGEAERLATRWGMLVVLAHEQLFRGPVPSAYRVNATRHGKLPSTVPYYEPNPSRAMLLHLLRSLPPRVNVSFVSGHVHDPQEVLQAGAPYLRGAPDEGMAYRLWGLGGTASVRTNANQPIRRLRHFHVPAGRVAVLVVGRGETRLGLLPPPAKPADSLPASDS